MTENVSAAKAAGASPARFGGRGLAVGIGVAAVVTCVGLVLWGMQIVGGMGQTAMGDFSSWGIYITCFMFFVGLSVGGLVIACVPCAFGIEGFGGISKAAVWTSICCAVCAVGFVVVDLGQPVRLWELFAYSNLASPLMWDIFAIAVYLILSIVLLWAMVRCEAGRMSARALRVVSFVALVGALLVISVDAWIFSLNRGHDLWHTALLAPWFISSALVCGTALVLAVVLGLRGAGYLALGQQHVEKMAKLLGAFVCVDLYFFACDLLTEGYPGGSGADLVAMLTTGALAPFFWVEIIGCVICAVVCFVPRLRTAPLVVVAAVLAIVGIFCKRVQLLVGGFQIPTLEGVTTSLTVTGWEHGEMTLYSGMIYWPSPIEAGVAIGIIGLGALLLLLGLKFLPLAPTDRTK